MNPQPTPADLLDSPRVLLPPRPNLGPEPLGDSTPYPTWAIASAVIVCVLVFLVVRLRRTRRRAAPAPVESPDGLERSSDPFHLLAESVRGRLVERFGEAWRARTTEEIVQDPEIAGVLGPEGFSKLIEFLGAADVVKYSGAAPDTSPLVEAWKGWVHHFLADDAAGASSMTTGK